MKVTIIATTAMGLEAVLNREIKALGYDNTKVFDGKVEFQGCLDDVCSANLWLRTAGRVYVKIGSFKAVTFDELFEQTKMLPWEEWIQQNDQFPVTKVMSRKSVLFSRSDCQSIVKKAIVERLKASHGITRLPETDALFPIRVQIEKDQVVLSIDTSGDGLGKRGYRAHMSMAPLRETLAAGMILLSRWRPEKDALLDPLCGTGTILIEAGLIAKNIAPGLRRSFLFESWDVMPKSVWNSIKEAAKEAVNKDASFRIYGSDHNGKTVSIARKNIELAGLSSVFVQTLELSQVSSRFEYGKVITNPPYGERLGNEEEVNALYSEMGQVFREKLPKWSYFVLTASNEFESLFGRKSTRHRKLFNGGIQCWYYQFYGSVA